jgi:MFS family permease
LVNLFANGMSLSCMPSLYGEISQDIPMTYAQWGMIWGMRSMPMMIFALLGGMVADRLGIRAVVGLSAIFMGLFGISRAFAQDFSQLLAAMFFIGMSASFLMPNLPKSLGNWFPSGELGLANGILIAGVCVGSGSALMLSGVYLSPLLGGWRNVMWLYGLISLVLGVIWVSVIREGGEPSQNSAGGKETFSFREALSVVIRVRDQWFVMVSRFCIFGALIGVIGFLPEILVSQGMRPGLAHLSSSLIYYANIIGVIAIPILSDRSGLRKIFIWPFSLVGALLVVSLGMFEGTACLIICALLGLVVGFIPLLMTLPMEMEGIGQRYFGTALGLVGSLGNFGSFVAPALGGAIIDVTGREWTGFIFWGVLMVIGSLVILPMKETGHKMKTLAVIENPME